MLCLMPISSFLCPRRAGWSEQALRQSARYVGATLGSGGLGPAPSPTHPVPLLCSALPWVPQLRPELKSLGTLRVNNRAIPSSPCIGWRPTKVGGVRGASTPGSAAPLRWGHHLVLSLSEGRTGATITGSAHGFSRSHGDPAAQQPHRLLLMSGSQLLFPWVFWAGSRGKARGGGWCRGLE